MILTFSALSSHASREICNHLWQSTLFALVIALLALAFRKYPAHARYSLWMAASAKFLVPFSLLIAAGSHLARPTHATLTQTSTYIAIDEMSQPFTGASDLQTIATSQPTPVLHILTLSTALAAVWLCGLLAVLIRWLIQWSRIAGTIRHAMPLREGRVVDILCRIERLAHISRPILILSSSGSMEPGVFGVLRPVLLWPEAISPHLDDGHLEAVLAHEAAHIRRRDNLTSLIHMLVEAIFWFHPLVWWMESQLVKERERACDEEVLLLCQQPQAYAESILKVCELCLESPLTCVSGITGADLKQRIVQIMTATTARKLGPAAKLLLLTASLLVAAVPVLAGRGRAMRSLSSQIVAPSPNVLPEKPSLDGAGAPSPSPASGVLPAPLALAAQSSLPPSIPADTSLPEFEVATIKPNDPSRHPGATSWSQTTQNELRIMGSLKTFLKAAYAIEDVQIDGGPKWLDSDLFEIDAKTGSAGNPAEMRLMFRALMQQRFKLVTHTETKTLPVYSLVAAKGGSKLKQAGADSDKGSSYGPTMVRGTLGTAQLARVLTPVLGRTVIDNTGLRGNYQIDLSWATDDQPSGPSLFTAIEEQLGLKLEPAKGPVDVLVIDSAQKPSLDGAGIPDQPAATLKAAAFVPETSAPPPNANTPYVPALTFDVASIRESKDPDRHGSAWVGHSELIVLNLNALWLVQMAYGVETRDISGQPSWAGQTEFYVDAKSDAATDQKMATLDKEKTHLEAQHMVQTLLTDRFNLKVHWETRQREVYNLVLAKDGSKLQPSGTMKQSPQESWTGDQNKLPSMHQQGDKVHGYEFYAHDFPIEGLAGLVSQMFGRDIVNRTGLTGNFDFHIGYHGKRPGDNRDEDPPTAWPPLITALESQLGLKLEPAKGSVQVLVIDHIEKPSEN